MKYLLLSILMFSALMHSATVHAGSITKMSITDSILHKPIALDEVIVTSYKEKKSFKEIPASVSILSADELDKANITDFKEISSYIPNLYFPDYGSKLTSPLYIRGIGSKLTPSVGLYVDGIPFFEKSVFDIDMNEVSRIEVLRGPQGTLYGRNTMGGIINVYTRDPLDYEGFNYRQTVGNYGQTDFSGAYYGKLSKQAGYSFSSAYRHSDGFFTNAFTGKKVDRSNHIATRGKLQWKSKNGLDGLFAVNYEYTDQGGYPYGLYHPTTGVTDSVNYNDRSSYRQGVLTAGLTFKYEYSGMIFSSITGYQNLNDRQAIDQDFTSKANLFVIQTSHQNQFSQELEMRSAGNHKWNWLNGLFGFYNKVDRTVLFNARYGYKEPSYGIAIYHQSTLKDLFIRKLSATIGVRLDMERDKQDYTVWTQTQDKNELSKHLNDGKTFTQFTPKFSLQYQFNSDDMMYATVTRGYKTGGFNVSFSSAEERTYAPEYSWNYEIGSKLSTFNGKLQADAALFYIDWRHQQISHLIPNGQILTNAGRSYSKGVELSLRAHPTDRLSLQLAYGYTQAKFRKYLYGTADYSGNYTPYIPRQTVMLGGNYTLDLHSRYIDRLLFSAEYTAIGRQYWNEANAVSQGFYGTLNGKISAVKKNMTVDLWIKNATSRKYTAYLFPLGPNYFAEKGKPLTFGTTISFSM
ncbi:MAG: TonB-dependent receptor [Prevotella sp.]|jgi:outer membrane receptor protein involved in Fe transport|nr:TonB-dependent receptor [Prevotella sp.]MCH4018175.1 TonB-dependent receptor [Prevotella sp.]MCI1324703.1 TonB-dependent receptor [Prevotella sp.]MCI1349404.1 TonB-dependent receptor [Prevotella sp.]MCI1415698.1 TonB-dependent receptor [Prevotella sp.]MCI1450432.1 TonB-dependent receptor [Prevotella sp.]